MSAQDLPTPLPVIEWREMYYGTLGKKRGMRIVERTLGIAHPEFPDQVWECRLDDGSLLLHVAARHIVREVWWDCPTCNGQGEIWHRNPRTASTPEDAEECASCGGSGGAWVRQPTETG